MYNFSEFGLFFVDYSLKKHTILRKRFEQQLDLRIPSIKDIKIPVKSRDELPPVLRALQYIFIIPAINEKIFALLEDKIMKGKKKTGRPGMDLWHILVLSVVRHTLNTDWDRLTWNANYDGLLRAILGLLPTLEEQEFECQTIIDNVGLIDEALLQEINNIVVEAGMGLIKKKEAEEPVRLKTDSFVVERNVHFPTDLSLLWDSSRKLLETINKLKSYIEIDGCRKTKYIANANKSQLRATTQQIYKGKNEEQKTASVKEYLRLAIEAHLKGSVILENPIAVANERQAKKVVKLLAELKEYNNYGNKFIDQINRRLLKGETIPASEKVYSIFEKETEWINKGKGHNIIELGHQVLVTTNQFHYIVDYKIMVGQKDVSQIPSLLQRIGQKYKEERIGSHSFDKGFWSKVNLELMEASKTETDVLPKRGKQSKADKERESTKEFKQTRKKHSAVESNINMLEHHGLARCRDKGMKGFERCVGLSVLAYNLHIMGKQLIALQKEKEKKQQYRIAKAAA